MKQLSPTRPVSPERNFWCSVIHSAALAASQGNETARQWFYSDMWDIVASMLFEPETVRAIEDAVLAGKDVNGFLRFRQKKVTA
jgi:hypothetical protein